MSLVVGVDIGNSTTEACAAEVGEDGEITYLSEALGRTSGVKGTTENVAGVVDVVRRALAAAGRECGELDAVLVNEATPVISGLAMETITETIITESTMIGHNPETPGGAGAGVGTTVAFADLPGSVAGSAVICVIGAGVDFEDAAAGINAATARGVKVTGAVVHADDANLIANRLRHPIPIVDEVTLVEKVPLGMPAAVEVAEQGRTIRTLSNSYGIATVFGLDAEQTRMIAPVARALVGNRSAVVVRTPAGDVTDRRIPAGGLTLIGEKTRRSVEMDAGAEEIKKFPLAKAESFFHIRLEDGTVRFFGDPLPADTFARVVVLTGTGLHPIPTRHSVDRIRQVRREAKRRVFVVNALRALQRVAPGGNIRRLDFVVALGGSALDFEIPDMIADSLAEHGIVCGTGNVRGREGPRNAVATGLVAGYALSTAGPRPVAVGS